MLALMQQNLELNPQLKGLCIVGELNWGESVPEGIPGQPDILLLADCVYLEVAFAPLVDTMREMATEQTEILVRKSSAPIAEVQINRSTLAVLLPAAAKG